MLVAVLVGAESNYRVGFGLILVILVVCVDNFVHGRYFPERLEYIVRPPQINKGNDAANFGYVLVIVNCVNVIKL